MNNYTIGYVASNGQVRAVTVQATNANRALDALIDQWVDTIEPQWIVETFEGPTQFASERVYEIKPLNAPQFRVAGPLA